LDWGFTAQLAGAFYWAAQETMAPRIDVREVRHRHAVKSLPRHAPPAADRDRKVAHGQQREIHMQDGSHQQSPILSAVVGDRASDPEAWDIRMEAHLGAFILQHLATDPAPPGARLADDARRWAENLQRDAQARQEALGRVVRLRAV
jgi:hypothetical protein